MLSLGGQVYFDQARYDWLASTQKSFLADTRKPWWYGVVSRIRCVCKGSIVIIKVAFLAFSRLAKIRGSSWGRLEKPIRQPAPEDT